VTGPAALLAGALRDGLERDGIAPPASLRLLRTDPAPDAPTVHDPRGLGTLHERLAGADERTHRGAWYTPAVLAERLVAHALPDDAAAALGPVVDPACGGGAFLLAAADRLVTLGWSPGRAAGHLRGRDVDPLAVAVTEAALWWWSARHGAPVVPHVDIGDSLLDGDDRGAGAVVGNPPFLNQLRAATSTGGSRRRALRDRMGEAVRAYTDPAWLFALRAVDDVVPGGRVVLVQPRSFLAARDAAEVRRRIDGVARLVDVVVVEDGTFDASVATCAPVLVRATDHCGPNDWTGALASAVGVPPVRLPTSPVLGSIADTHAGFRDEYYGMAGAVVEGGTGPRLATVGAIDPMRLLGRPQRFSGRRWDDPRVDVDALAGRAARWASLQATPKVLVATQTRVLECVPDPDGALLGSVPAIVVRPRDADDLWRVTAALHAPAASAWALRQHIGTGRSADTCRPTAALLASLPLPADRAAWDVAAVLAERCMRGDATPLEVAVAAQRAYGGDDALLAWWEARRPQR
ncbi:MAG TPA: N-6 DNA methylase, partial [Acidimicrobiales bacterium]|nr:N-6 DNA methylase [Acidimicrobiales bacterium]